MGIVKRLAGLVKEAISPAPSFKLGQLAARHDARLIRALQKAHRAV